MNTRATKTTALAQLSTAASDAQRRGVSYSDALAALQRAYQPAASALSPEVAAALRRPTDKASVQVLEAVEADALTKRLGWPGHAASHCDVGEPGKRNSHTVYVRDLTRREFRDSVVESRVLLSATQHNLGADLVQFVDYDPDDGVTVHLAQQKVGSTALHAGRSASNANRSMVFIADKLEQAGELVEACIGEEFDLEVRLLYSVDTTSRVSQTGRDHARRRGVEVRDANWLWDNCWPQPVKSALVELHGSAERGKHLGLV